MISLNCCLTVDRQTGRDRIKFKHCAVELIQEKKRSGLGMGMVKQFDSCTPDLQQSVAST